MANILVEGHEKHIYFNTTFPHFSATFISSDTNSGVNKYTTGMIRNYQNYY